MPVVNEVIPKKKEVKTVAKRTFSLPTEKNEPPNKLTDSIFVVFGRKNIGKTSLLSQFDNCLVAMFEKYRRGLNILMVPQHEDETLDWEAFKAYVDLFIADEKLQLLAVDTIDRAYDYCMEWVCKQNNCTHPNDKNDYGKTWQLVKKEFQNVFSKIRDSGKGLAFISHETSKPLAKTTKGLLREDRPNVSVVERLEPSCSKQAFEVIQEICDFVFYYGYEDEHRCITVRSPSDYAWTACGISDRFLDPDGVPLKTFKVGSSPEEAYKTLIAAYNNQVRDIEYVAPREKPLFSKSS